MSTSRNKKLEDFPFQTARDFFPKFYQNEAPFDDNLKELTSSFLKQSVLKQLLTEGIYHLRSSWFIRFSDINRAFLYRRCY